MSRLLFSNPVFHDGANVTVRYGNKWAGAVVPGSTVEVWGTEAEEKEFDAKVLAVHLGRICDIPSYILALEHDPGCRTHEGLITELKRVYPAVRPLNSRTKVTVLMVAKAGDPWLST